MYARAYAVLDNLCQPRHGSPADTLLKVMSNLFNLKYRFVDLRSNVQTPTAWFIGRLTAKTGCPVAAAMMTCAQSILSNVNVSAGGPDTLTANMEVCARYETALWRSGSAAVLRYTVEEMARSDGAHRLHALELALRLLVAPVTEDDFGTMASAQVAQADRVVASDTGADDTAAIPAASPLHSSREVLLLRLVLVKMMDNIQNVRMKAMAGFMRLSGNGNVRVKEILRVSREQILPCFCCCKLCRNFYIN